MSEEIFVGREKELSNFQQLLDEVRGGNGKIVFMHGESGSGKTTLIRKFVKENDEGCLISISDCVDKDGINPYAPFKTVLAQLNSDAVSVSSEKRKSTKDRLLAVLNESGPEWIAAIPVIGEITNAGIRTVQASKRHFGNKMSVDTIKGAEDVQNVYENELRRLSKKEPVIIFLDDLQWADQSSLNLIFVLGRSLRVNPFPILFIGSYRPHDISMGREQINADGIYQTVRHPFLEILNELRNYTKKESHIKRKDQWLVEMTIDPFQSNDIDDLITKLFPQNKFPVDFSDELEKLTEGNPLFATEILEYLDESGKIADDDKHNKILTSGTIKDLPTSIDGIVGERISHLNENLKKVIECATVNGNNFISLIIEKVLRIDELDLMDFLSELNQKHDLIVNKGTEFIDDEILELYQFTHRLIHNFVYQGIEPAKRRLLHKRVAQVLRTIYGKEFIGHSDIQEQYTQHLQIAKGLIDGVTLKLAVTAPEDELDIKDILNAARSETASAAQSFQQYAISESITHADKGLAFLVQLPEMTVEAKAIKFEALSIRNKAHHWLGHFDEAFQIAQEMYDLAIENNNNELIYIALQRLGTDSSKLGNYRKAIDYQKQSLNIVKEDHVPIKLGQIYREMGHQYRYLGDYCRAIELFGKAVDIHKQLEANEELAEDFNEIAFVFSSKNEFDNAIEQHQTALKILEEVQDEENIGAVYDNIGTVLLSKGDFKNAIEYFEKALTIHKNLEKEVSASFALDNIGNALELQGDYDGALEYYQQSLKIVKKLNNRVNMAIVYSNIGGLMDKKGDFDGAIEYFKKALNIAEAMDDRVKMATRYNKIGIALKSKGDIDEAIKYYKRALEIFVDLDDQNSIALVHNNIGMLLQKKGDFEEAIINIQKSLKIAEEIGNDISAAIRYNNLAMIYHGQLDYRQAISSFEKALSIVERLNDHVKVAHICRNIGKLYIKLERFDKALTYIRQAREIWNSLGFVPANVGKTLKEIDTLIDVLKSKVDVNSLL